MKHLALLHLFLGSLFVVGCASRPATAPSGTTSAFSAAAAKRLARSSATNFVGAYPTAPAWSEDESSTADFRVRAAAYLKQLQGDIAQIEAKEANAQAKGAAASDAFARALAADSTSVRVAYVPGPTGDFGPRPIYYPIFPNFNERPKAADDAKEQRRDSRQLSLDPRLSAIIEVQSKYSNDLYHYLHGCENDQRLLETKLSEFRRYLADLAARDVRFILIEM